MLARNQTEANITNPHLRDNKKQEGNKDRMTPFNKKKINIEESKNAGNLTSRLGIIF